jgi:ribosomal protein S18 acetylase RimI-like enzyme
MADYSALILKQLVTVAEADEALAGVLVCYSHNDALHVKNVAVNLAFQGHRIGGLLMDYAESEAKSEDLAQVELYTNEVMVENISYYKDRGYSVRKRAIQDGYARIFFKLDLNSDASE